MFSLIKTIKNLLGLEKPEDRVQPPTRLVTPEPALPIVQPTVVQIQETNAARIDVAPVIEKPKRQRKPKAAKDPAITAEPKVRKAVTKKKKETDEKPNGAE